MKISKKNVSGWGFEPETKMALTIVTVCHTPPHLLHQLPFFIYQTRIGYIRIHMHENLGHRGYEFILFNPDV